MQATNGTTVRSAHPGTLVRNTSYGAACIQYGSRTYIYAHMSNLKAAGAVKVGDIIGNQSNVTASGSIASHLHFEVRGSLTTSMGSPTANNSSGNLSPYSYMVEFSSLFDPIQMRTIQTKA